MQMLFAIPIFVLHHILITGQKVMLVNEICESNLIDFPFWKPTKDPSDCELSLVFDLIFAISQ